MEFKSDKTSLFSLPLAFFFLFFALVDFSHKEFPMDQSGCCSSLRAVVTEPPWWSRDPVQRRTAVIVDSPTLPEQVLGPQRDSCTWLMVLCDLTLNQQTHKSSLCFGWNPKLLNPLRTSTIHLQSKHVGFLHTHTHTHTHTHACMYTHTPYFYWCRGSIFNTGVWYGFGILCFCHVYLSLSDPLH